jgi:hypothetical protein
MIHPSTQRTLWLTRSAAAHARHSAKNVKDADSAKTVKDANTTTRGHGQPNGTISAGALGIGSSFHRTKSLSLALLHRCYSLCLYIVTG